VGHEVVQEPLTDALINFRHRAAGDVDVRASVLLGDHWSIVFDTLYSPRDLPQLCDLVERRGRPVIIVNSHADDDHAWGNSALPMAVVVGHDECRARFLDVEDLPAQLERRRAADPEEFEQVVLRPPDVTFRETLTIHAGGFTVVLVHLPGHKRDCIIAHVPELGLFLGGDTIEDPFPLLVDGPRLRWASSLRSWAARNDVKVVVPSHGPITDTTLLLQNAEYLESLVDPDKAARRQPSAGRPEFYIAAHDRNRARAAQLRD
jgi:glyoxylase-like metal-dependent hydrolase (beta-lactamase superfamily II)